MNIRINNNLSDLVELDIIKNKNEVVINVNKKQKTLVPLKEVPAGTIVKVGEIECIVLGGTKEGKFLITKKTTAHMKFGNIKNNYELSNVRSYCNGNFYKLLSFMVGKENIVPHNVFLETEDGYKSNPRFISDKVSIITTRYYRRFREYIQPSKYPWWTATPVTKSSLSTDVCYIENNGIIDKTDIDCNLGVRPFFCLKSSLKVEIVNNN